MATMPFTPCTADPCTDVTVSILQTVFGPVIRNLTLGADPGTVDPVVNVIATMMSYFNSGVLTVAMLIVSFITVMGVINTANDGEAFGKNWSSLWTPVRIVSGAAVLLPTGTGYSFIQLIVMMFSLWSVGFANGTFKMGVENGIIAGSLQNVSQQIGVGSSATANKDFPLFNMRELASNYMVAAYCAKTVNAVYGEGVVAGLVPPNVSLNTGGTPDRQATEAGIKTTYTYEFKDRNLLAPLAGGNAVCGTVNLYEYQHVNPTPSSTPVLLSAVFDDAARDANNQAISLLRDAILAAKLSAVKDMMREIDSWVASWPGDINQDWSTVSVNTFNTIADNAQTNMLSNLRSRMQSDNTLKGLMERFTNDITKDGWAMAGGYYQRLGGIREELRKIYAESPGTVTQPALRWLPEDAKGNLVRQSAIMPAVIARKALDGSGYTPKSITDTGNVASIIPVDLDDVDIDQMGERGNKVMNSLVGRVMESVTNAATGADGNSDAIARIKTTGDILAVANGTLSGIGKLLDTAVTTGRVIAAATTGVPIVGGVSKAADILSEFLGRNILQPIAEISGWIDILAFYFGVFLPSLPYTIFIVAVVGWLLAVLQTVFAAPLWAVMHMTPDRTFVGSQTQGYLMFLSLFMRPVLIIAALFAAMLLANPIVLYVSKAFWAMRTANVSSSESLGFFVQFLTWKNWMIMYGLMLGPIVYMIFGLTNTLPDAILTWIGAGIKPLGETQATAEMRSGMERHGASARGAALGAAAGARRLPPAGSGNAGRGGGAMPSGGSGLGYAGAAAGGAAAGAAYAGGAGSDAHRAHRPISDTGQSKGHDTPDYVPPEQSPSTSSSRAAGTAGVAAGAAAQNYSSGQDRLVNNESATAGGRPDDARADDGSSRNVDANGNRPLSNEAASTAGVGAVLNSDTAQPSGTAKNHMLDDNESDRSAAA